MIRILPWVAVVGVVTFPGIGIVARLQSTMELESSASALVPPKLIQSSGLYAPSLEQIDIVQAHWDQMPAMCRDKTAQSQFNQDECRKVELRAWIATATLAVPLVFMILFMLLAQDRLLSFYRAARKKLESEPARIIGVVTNPPLKRNSHFASVFCLKTVAVEIAGKPPHQIPVLIDDDAPSPLAGQKYIVHDLGNWLGHRRYVGQLYAPHLAVVSGGSS